MKIKDIGRISGRPIITIGPDATVRHAVQMLVENNIGALPVCDKSGAVLGIISERDLLKACSKGTAAIDDTPVEAVMTKDIVVAVPEDEMDYISQVMINHGGQVFA